MSLLREYIRMLLTEAAKGPTDLPEDVFVVIIDKGFRFKFFYAIKNDAGEYVKTGGDAYRKGIPWGSVGISRPYGENGPCGDAWEVHGSTAKQGWGPMLYDIAMEWASKVGGGLMADREAVSGDARRVWDYYLNNRGDVTSDQLDNLANELTPDIEEDNCRQSPSLRGMDPKSGSPTHVDWTTSALSKRYTKAPTTINTLEAAGKLVIE